ncbi:MAG: bifunctional 4-hydroxy-3-methylbut-2-enyl diphosphate reductase/30S ribosomal protein S1 [Clostridiales bacterium]|nr:bifunctional 4-hydroxy-3-methylbut-2-enyl diphosphate reductase/30S ribosomal protein S1 [Clostridiales bacterium]
MEFVIAKSGGFCRGVKKAVDTALAIDPKNTYIYGEIIHNPEVVQTITDRGIAMVEELDQVPCGATLIIRSHGVGRAVYELCKERNITVVDCTCEFVRRTQTIVKEEYAKGKTIIIIGEKTHPEVVGLNGWCDNKAYVFSSEEEDFSILPPNDCCVVAQTTYSEEKFEKIIKNLNNIREKTVEVFKTICYTTIGRQNEARELAKECEAVLVIGGLNSSNTNKLFDICTKHCSNVFRLSSAADLEYKTIKRFKKVGIVTGASTPNAQTQEVLLKMEMETEAKATSMEEVVANMDSQPKFKKGQLIKATISSADDSGVAVLLPLAKKEVILDKEEVDCEVYNKDDFNAKLGEEIELMVVAVNPVKLSQKQIKAVKEEEAAIAEIQAGKEFEVVCTGFNKGGLTSELGSYTVFVPAREIRSGYVKELDKYVGKKLRLRLIEIKTERRKEIIASQRVIIEEERAAKEAAKAAKEAEFFASIHVDDVVEGKVERVTAFGAFVSVNGFDCLAHISDLSWTGVKSVTDVLEIGKKYEFKVLKIDEEAKKVSIGYKQLQAQPWELAAEKYAEGDVIHGKVVRIVPFGAFVEVEKGIDGLVHVSQISHEFLENPTTALAIGQEIDAKILKLDCAEKKMTLSIKALEPKPENLERKPRAAKAEDGEVKEKARKPREAKPADEVTEWHDGGLGGVSIADLLNKNS